MILNDITLHFSFLSDLYVQSNALYSKVSRPQIEAEAMAKIGRLFTHLLFSAW